jgi:hypothetical protein
LPEPSEFMPENAYGFIEREQQLAGAGEELDTDAQ